MAYIIIYIIDDFIDIFSIYRYYVSVQYKFVKEYFYGIYLADNRLYMSCRWS
ncbi:hypothetical protein C7439_1518 [Lachnoanaerobaculum umeaense]|nr:hypothetical protein C7439_1518 [Lachnoanaerobaculum umeaense]